MSQKGNFGPFETVQKNFTKQWAVNKLWRFFYDEMGSSMDLALSLETTSTFHWHDSMDII